MAHRNLLHKSKLNDFKEYLDSKDIAYRPGKGPWQALQVQVPIHGWQCIFIRANMLEHYTVQDKLYFTVKRYLRSRK